MKKIILIAFTILFLKTQAQIKSTPFGKGINFAAKDTSMTLKFHFRMQQLYIGEQGLTQGSRLKSNFLVRRARLKFNGFAFSPKIQYKAEIGLTNRDIGTNKEDGNGSGAARMILDAVVKWKFQKNLTLLVGQTKLPGNRERVISSANLQFVDRSLVNSKFNIDRDAGLQLHGKYAFGDFVIKPKLAWTMGEGRDITSGNLGLYNYTGRLEILPLGEFTNKGDYFGSDLKREQKPKLAFGFTYNYNDNAVRQQGQLGDFLYDSTGNAYVQNDLKAFLADVMYKYQGFSLMAEYANTISGANIGSTENASGSSKKYHTGSGISVQAGYLLKSNWEIAARYTDIKPDNSTYSGITATTEYTFGVSRYIVGHSLKIQSDISLIDKNGTQSVRFRLQTEMQF